MVIMVLLFSPAVVQENGSRTFARKAYSFKTFHDLMNLTAFDGAPILTKGERREWPILPPRISSPPVGDERNSAPDISLAFHW